MDAIFYIFVGLLVAKLAIELTEIQQCKKRMKSFYEFQKASNNKLKHEIYGNYRK